MPSSSNTKVSNFWRPSTFIAICLDLLTPKVADLWSGDVHPVGFFSGGGVCCLLGGRQAESFNLALRPLQGEVKTLRKKAAFSLQSHCCRVNAWYKDKDLVINRSVLPTVCVQYYGYLHIVRVL